MKWFWYFFGFLMCLVIVYDRITIERLSEELAAAQDKIAIITKVEPMEIKRSPIQFIKRDKSRSMVFTFLYEINREKKRIKYLPGELLIEDITLSQDDQFLDLLDFLFEQDLLVTIQLPSSPSIKEDMKLAGFSSEFFTKSADGQWRIKIRE